MVGSRRGATIVSFLVVLGLMVAVPAARGAEQQVPSCVVKAAGPSTQQAAVLSKRLELLGNPRNRFGGLVYMSPNYGNLPTRSMSSGGAADEAGRKVTRQGFDLPAIMKLQ